MVRGAGCCGAGFCSGFGFGSGFRVQALVHLTIAFAQINPTVGDIDGNLARIRAARDRAAAAGADLVVLPELAVIGYPPEDLVLRPSVVDACRAAVECLIRESRSGPAVIATTPWREDGMVYNAAVIIDDGRSAARFKVDLPNYGVFDEKRVFRGGPLPSPVTLRGVSIGVPICEDIWTPAVTDHLARAGAELFIVPNGSPFEAENSRHASSLRALACRDAATACLRNQVGGQDELVFDGHPSSSTPPARLRMRCRVGKRRSTSRGGRALPADGPASLFEAVPLSRR